MKKAPTAALMGALKQEPKPKAGVRKFSKYGFSHWIF
jgi:hypothetical protein